MKKVEINNKLYTVCTMDEYTDAKCMYNPKFTAIETNGVVLPIRGANEKEPGIYYDDNCMVAMINKPNEEDISNYSTSKIIDFSNSKDIGEIFEKKDIIRNIQNDIITTNDNIMNLKISDEDTPEMKALKTAINSKHVDIKQYEDRFDQFQNDMRLLKGKSITLGKLVSICTAFDISADLTLRDNNNDVPNPMNQTINIDLTKGRE